MRHLRRLALTIGRLRVAMRRKPFDPTFASDFGAIVVIVRYIVLEPGRPFETTVPPEALLVDGHGSQALGCRHEFHHPI